MSHFVEVKTNLKDAAVLKDTLTNVFGACEAFPNGGTLEGMWSPGVHPPKCNLIVRKETHSPTGAAYADLGYRKAEDNTYGLVVDDQDKGLPGLAPKLAVIAQQYARNLTVKQARLSGYTVTEQAQKDGSVQLTLSKW